MPESRRYPPELVREAAPYLRSWLEFQRGLQRTPGVQVAIRVDGELLFSEALGHADESADIPLRTDHLFRIASHSKTFTATAIMQLVEAGRVRLDDPISAHVAELDDSELASVTVRELLGHQGGVIRDSVDADFWQLMRPFPDRAELIELCRTAGRIYDRDEYFKYSNVGFSLLGLVIESVSGRSYREYVTEHIVDRLELTDTGPEYDPARADQYAAGHTALLHGAEPREVIGHIDTRGMAAATGFYSTAADLTRYGAAHCTGAGELIADHSKRLLQRQESVVTAHDREQGRYGLGMALTTIGDRDWVGHSGGYPGHITVTFVQPTEKIAVSVFTNCISGPATQLAEGVIKLLDLAADAPPAEQPDGVDLDAFTGRFANLWGVLDIARLGGRLVGLYATAADPTATWDELAVTGADTLRVTPAPGYGGAGEPVHLDRGSDGSAESIRYAGSTRWPVEVFRQRRRSQIAAAGQSPG